MAVVVEPVLSEEKLHALLAERHEQSALDYKKTLNLGRGNARDVVELAKDVAAMQAEPAGGYIVIGVDDHGNTVPDLTSDLARHFDEATVGPKLAKYLHAPEVRTAQHEVDGHIVVLIYVAPSDFGWCIFREVGEYEEPQPGGRPKKETVFRVGDVFVRHGTRSERWTDADRDRLVRQIVARRKEAWGAEIRQELAALAATSVSTHQLQQLPATALTWHMDAVGFEELITEFIRRGDDIPIQRLLNHAAGDAASLLGSDQDELRQLLDRVTIVAGLAIQYGRGEWLDRALAAMVRLYELGLDEHGHARGDLPTVWMWLDIVTRVYGLGGLAVRFKAWNAVRILADRQPQGEPFKRYGSWLRHGLTMALRAHLFDTEDKSSLLGRAHIVVRDIRTLHPDRPADDDAVLSSLCQFDLLGAFVVIGQRGDVSYRNFYPNFAGYYSRRTEPAFVLVVTDLGARRQLFDGDDTLLADAIAEINRTASRESVRVWGPWDGIDDERVTRFVEEHRSPTES